MSLMAPSTPPSHMRALFHASHNQPRYHLLPGTLPIPKPHPGTVLIKVRAAAVTPTDVANLRKHGYLFVPGMALSGELVHGTPDHPPGTKVAALCAGGAWAEYATVPENAFWQISTRFEEAAALAGVVSASLQAVRAADLQPGEVVVVGGGVTAAGCVIAQLASVVYGARVVLAVRGPAQARVAELVGAGAVVDRERERVADRLAAAPPDAAFDTAADAARLARLVRPGGRVVRVMPVGARAAERARDAARKAGVHVLDVYPRADDRAVRVVKEVVANMPLRATSGPIYGVAKWMRALEAAERGVASGCVVVMF